MIGVEGTPVLLVSVLTVETDAVGFPRLLESLKVEYIKVPIKGCADAVAEEVLSVLRRGYSRSLHFGVVVVAST